MTSLNRLRPITLAIATLLPTFLPAAEPPDADVTIRREAGPSTIVIKTTSRLAGAIDSLTWGGKEFIDSFDHGRQLQSASNFDTGKPFIPEVFNPTEAGSMADGTGTSSSSKLLAMTSKGSELQSTTQMAFWLAPGEKSAGQPARNDKVLSDHRLSKHVRIGYRDLPQVIEYDVTFTVPSGEHHTYAQFEALTGYLPAEFSRFWKFDRSQGTLAPLDDGPGEQAWPVVLATPSGSHAMGIYSPEQAPGYGRFRFPAAKVTKWNCVFRVTSPNGVPPGEYSYKMFVAVGTLEDVRNSLKRLVSEPIMKSP